MAEKDQGNVQQGNVQLIDPQNYDDNTQFSPLVNGINQYQDMYISAELTAIKRGRTILSTNLVGNITTYDDASLTGDRLISFLGENQDPDSPNYGKFTTNWYDGNTSDPTKQFEGFGISSINVTVDSSYIPQISVQFIDTRGLAFFNRGNSPYRILFDFPPPLFYLKIKGYFGKGTTYQMHLVNYSTEFRAETGNYHIDAKFVAITYAPLTDVLFRYIVQNGLISDQNFSVSPDNEPPINTMDLVFKMDRIFDESFNKQVKADSDSKDYEEASKNVNLYSDIMSGIANISNNPILADAGDPIVFTYNTQTGSKLEGELSVLGSLNDYNRIIKTLEQQGSPDNMQPNLFIGFKVGSQQINDVVGPIVPIVPDDTNVVGSGVLAIADDDTSFIDDLIATSLSFLDDEHLFDSEIKKFNNVLNRYRIEYLLSRKDEISGTDISGTDVGESQKITEIKESSKDDPTNRTIYAGINITKYYLKLNKERTTESKNKTTSMEKLNVKINQLIKDKLGMTPTIYNIFKILLDDVDKFFSKLRKVSQDSEEHHEIYKDQIINDSNYVDNNEKIYPFPLIIENEEGPCGGKRQTKTAPIEISKRLEKPFPELEYVQEFIDSFVKYNRILEQINLRNKTDEHGDDLWMPFTPVDSSFSGSPLVSPYAGNDFNKKGVRTRVFDTFLKRFYVLSQNALFFSFSKESLDSWKNGSGDVLYEDYKTSSDYLKLYAKAESYNLVNSLSNPDVLGLFKSFSEENNKTDKLANGFYAFLDENLSDLYSKPSVSYLISGSKELYKNKYFNDEYEGVAFASNDDIEFKEGNPEGVFDKFVEKSKVRWGERFWQFEEQTNESRFKFTKENLIYLPDTITEDGIFTGSKNKTQKTKFIGNRRNFIKKNDKNDIYFIQTVGFLKENPAYTSKPITAINNLISKIVNGINPIPYPAIINDLNTQGNQYFFNEKISYKRANNMKVKNYQSIPDLWIWFLSAYGTELNNGLLNGFSEWSSEHKKLVALLYLSNFGYTLSAFNYYPYSLNRDYFSGPALVELPKFVKLYMGALVGVEKGGDGFWELIYDFFTKDSFTVGDVTLEGTPDRPQPGKEIQNGGVLIFSDISDINTHLSEKDKDVFKSEFDHFLASDTFKEFAKDVSALIVKIDELEPLCDASDDLRDKKVIKCKYDKYEKVLNVDNPIIEFLMDREVMVVFNEITFRFLSENDIPKTYIPLKSIVEHTSVRDKNYTDNVDLFFSEFFNQVSNIIDDRKKEIDDKEDELKNLTGDKDIMNQTYYSFKNIYDKWLAGTNKTDTGYPYKNDPKGALIDQFAFVNRAMKPIGNTIIDARQLKDMLDNPEVSIFSLISNILSTNGFEFFPLQNFMSYTNDDWLNSFKMSTGPVEKQFPVFVCMFIGGTSSYASGIGEFSDYEDDGIIELDGSNLPDFDSGDCKPNPADDGQDYEDNRLYNQVKAFKVRYGEQNQTMFHGIDVNSTEFTETNEAIQILSRLAGDNRQATPKGQNLYNIYENRAYGATVTGYGNVMIQPTQYFQLENVPIYNGAYIILSVEHNIEPNKMITKFSGTKILKYPIPRVLNPASIVGFDGGSSDETNISIDSGVGVVIGSGSTDDNPTNAKYNSMYDLEIT